MGTVRDKLNQPGDTSVSFFLAPSKARKESASSPGYTPVVIRFDNPFRFLIQSETHPEIFYLVDLEECLCDCDHFRIRKPLTCKHLQRAMGHEPIRTDPEMLR
jgi:hypothetical protein